MFKLRFDGSEETGGLRRFNEILTLDFFNLFRINLLTVLAMVPLVTIPPAVMAMEASVWEIVHSRKPMPYWRCFRTYWRRSYPVFLLAVLLPAMAAVAAVFYAQKAAALPLTVVLCAFSIFVLALSALAASYLYPLAADRQRPFRQLIPAALTLAFSRPLRGLAAFLISAGLLVLFGLYLPLSLPYFLLGGLAFPCLLSRFLIRRIAPDRTEAEEPF